MVFKKKHMQQINQIEEELRDLTIKLKVIDKHSGRCFQITDFHAGPEFDRKGFYEFLKPGTLHIYSRDEHIGPIERDFRTIKERLRCTVHYLPYKRHPKLMVVSLLERVIFWLNSFPSDTEISSTMNPSTIMEGCPCPDFNQKHIAFGAYAMVNTCTMKNIKARDIPDIALQPLNETDGYIFMSLLTCKKIRAVNRTHMPIPDEAFTRVEDLADQENI